MAGHPWQLAFKLEGKFAPTSRRQHRALKPEDVRANSRREATLFVRRKRRVRATDEGWEVLATDASYQHRIALIRRGDDLDVDCIAPECLATRRHPCWATAKVLQSPSFITHFTRLYEAIQQESHDREGDNAQYRHEHTP